MTLETERLEIYALTPGELLLLAEDMAELEKSLAVTYRAEPVEGHFREIVLSQARVASEDRENYLWHTFWLIIRKEGRVVVGSIDFKSPPDEEGMVEIGYGLGEEFEKNGYMSETVRRMRLFALETPGVTGIKAETEKDNIASQNVLKNCGFVLYRREETLWWKL